MTLSKYLAVWARMQERLPTIKSVDFLSKITKTLINNLIRY